MENYSLSTLFQSRYRNPVLIVFLLSIVMRIVVVVLILRSAPFKLGQCFGFESGQVALSLVEGRGFSSPFGGNTGPTAWPPILFTFLSAGLFKVFGSFSFGAAVVVTALNILLESGAGAALCLYGEKYLGTYVGFASGVVFAIYPQQAIFALRMWDTCFATAIIAVSVFAYRRLCVDDSNRLWALWGVFCGIAILLSTQLMILLAVISAAATRRLRNAALALLLCLAILAPWTVRNLLTFHRLVPIRSNFGVELWLGNHAGAGVNDQSLHPLNSEIEMSGYRKLGESEYVLEKDKIAHTFISEHPRTFLRMSVARIWIFWTAPDPDTWTLFSLSAFLGLILMMAFDWRRSIPIIGALTIFPLPYYITHSEPQYRHPIDPVILLMSSYFAVTSFNFVTSLRSKRFETENGEEVSFTTLARR